MSMLETAAAKVVLSASLLELVVLQMEGPLLLHLVRQPMQAVVLLVLQAVMVVLQGQVVLSILPLVLPQVAILVLLR